MADVRLAEVVKRWGPSVAVDGISFSIRQGSFVALLGPSGCGKSTTLRLIAGLDNPTSGTIHIGARDVTREPPAKRGVSMVFQSYALFPHLTVAENILFGLKVRKVPAAEQKARLAKAADMLGLAALLDRKPSELSGGQQQRTALGRAVVAETPICLMDEPLSNLDAQLRVEMRREIRDLQRKLGITMIYVTHDQLEAMTMADQVVLMNAGRIEQDATPAELYNTPATIFAARFIGTPPMNVIPFADLPEPPDWLPASKPCTRALDQLAFGIRPESIRPAESGLRAKISAIEYLGADSLVEASAGRCRIVARLPGRAASSIGEDISLAWDSSETHWFDLSSGGRTS
ncbi:ABC transporter ATP-binding protein [Hyphomicrobium sp. CS1BSMeth3]|uniref:ABC transporter ATP-binding protein n=1 Tax=Hyphomicrobium sp. CS1BSMeth3 TaxID=1892844 RepID=UPI00093072E9|nr:ABC transporter ATP-binding protein [Hyphomicrobium sp. CS1BSMeth3]